MQPDRKTPPETHPLGRLLMPSAETTTLDNGMTMVSYSGGDSEVNRIVIATSGGIAEEPVAGMTVLGASLQIDGTGSRSASDIADILDFNGSWHGTEAQHHASVLKFYSLNSRMDEILPVITDIVSNPVFPDHETAVAREKAARNAALNAEKVSYLAQALSNRMVMGDECPLSRTPQPDTLRQITPDRLRDNYINCFNPKMMTVYLTGRITAELKDQIAFAFGNMKAKGPGIKPVDIQPKPPKAPHTEYLTRKNSLQSAIVAAIPTIGRDNPDYNMLRIAIVLLGGYFGSRLMTNIRESKGYTYGIGASLSGFRHNGIASVYTECDNRYTTAVIDEIRSEIIKLQDPSSYTTDEMNRARNFMLSELASELDTPFSIMDYRQSIDFIGLPSDYFSQRQDAIENMTPEKLAHIASRYISPDNLYIAIAGERP